MRWVHEEHGVRAAVEAFAGEGAASLADVLAVPGLPAADPSQSSQWTTEVGCAGEPLVALLANIREHELHRGTEKSNMEIYISIW